MVVLTANTGLSDFCVGMQKNPTGTVYKDTTNLILIK